MSCLHTRKRIGSHGTTVIDRCEPPCAGNLIQILYKRTSALNHRVTSPALLIFIFQLDWIELCRRLMGMSTVYLWGRFQKGSTAGEDTLNAGSAIPSAVINGWRRQSQPRATVPAFASWHVMKEGSALSHPSLWGKRTPSSFKLFLSGTVVTTARHNGT